MPCRLQRLRMGLLALLLALSISADARAQTNGTRASGGPRRTASIAGRVIHADGAAADGARVAVYAVREGVAAAIVGTATSAYDGRYEVSGLPAGQFMVGVTPRKASGFGGDLKRAPAMPVETFYPGIPDRDRAQAITVHEAVPAEGIDVWLAPAPQRFSIGGRIFWPEGVDVRNMVIEYGGAGGLRNGVWYVHDPGGLFTIEGAAQGTYVLMARGETAAGPLIGLASTDVALGPVEDVRIVLRAPGSIDGRLVVDSPGNVGVAGYRVSPLQTLITLSPIYPVEAATVAENGRFTLHHVAGEYTLNVLGLPDGWRVKRILHNGAVVTSNRIVISPGERITDVEIVIGAGTT